MLQRTKLLDRNFQYRDAWLCILVTEGEETERQYFEGLQSLGIINRSRLKVEVVPASPEAHDSAPQHVCTRADEFAKKYGLNFDYDQVWLVLDVDRWGNRNLANALNHAREKRYGMAVSNPCFEVWLLLHLTEEILDLTRGSECEARLRQILGSYNKANLDLTPYGTSAIRLAIARARGIHPKPSGWPESPGSFVHLLMDQILTPEPVGF